MIWLIWLNSRQPWFHNIWCQSPLRLTCLTQHRVRFARQFEHPTIPPGSSRYCSLNSSGLRISSTGPPLCHCVVNSRDNEQHEVTTLQHRERERERGAGGRRKNITERHGTTNSKSESAFFLCWLCFGLFFCLRPGFWCVAQTKIQEGKEPTAVQDRASSEKIVKRPCSYKPTEVALHRSFLSMPPTDQLDALIAQWPRS